MPNDPARLGGDGDVLRAHHQRAEQQRGGGDGIDRRYMPCAAMARDSTTMLSTWEAGRSPPDR
ncbi:hypothetical protein ACFSVK_08250 [Azorhizophilus paspali]|uniref:hypothetical protein n=1 Tax=Azorhizophilus paspali TaxID=69963 RepID=UPI00363E2702